jgi:hypothetical protein
MPALDNAKHARQSLGNVKGCVGLGQRNSIFLAQFVSDSQFDLFTENGTPTGKMKESFLGNEMEHWNFHLRVNDKEKNVHGVLGHGPPGEEGPPGPLSLQHWRSGWDQVQVDDPRLSKCLDDFF